LEGRPRNVASPMRPVGALMSRSAEGSKSDLTKLARLIVLLLAGLDSRPATPDEIVLWLGSAPGRTKACIQLAISRRWVQRKERGIIVLKAGRKMLTRPPSDWAKGQRAEGSPECFADRRRVSWHNARQRSCAPRVRAMAQSIYEAKITPAVGDDPIVVSVPADDSMHARRLIEEQFGPIRHWWSEPTPKANG
jgi:hypothetical protein